MSKSESLLAHTVSTTQCRFVYFEKELRIPTPTHHEGQMRMKGKGQTGRERYLEASNV
jgi:hypothetical protein